MHFGGYAVDVFIVLSGYCIMIPVARSADGALRDGFRGFMKRRARRILPPYYAALLLCLALGAAAVLRAHGGGTGRQDLPDMSAGSIVSHLLLVHNLKAGWAQAFDPPMWSVATEWQIYFLFPPLLLPVWRRYGNGAVVCAGFALGILPILFTHGRWFWWASPWFVGLYAMGMAGAAIQYRDGRARPLRLTVPWRALSIGLFCAICAVSTVFPRGAKYPYVIGMDVLVGAFTVALIGFCMRAGADGGERAPVALRVLESRWALLLGSCSYSLYLVHDIVNQNVIVPVLQPHLGPVARSSPAGFALDVIVKLTTVLACTYLFYRLFERPFTVRRA